ncbi:GPTC4 protein, partial [Odontophorus gujanensis]|nr:GPTC4 protein [Odontophorus gujanensis]
MGRSRPSSRWALRAARRKKRNWTALQPGGNAAGGGARHGLTMSAKLARLEQQERAFLAAMQHRGGGQPESPHGSAKPEKEKKKKKKRKRSVDGADVEGLQSQKQSRGQKEAGERRVGKRKKKMRRKDEVAKTEVPPADTSGPGEAEYSLRERRKKKKAEGGRVN